MIDLTRKLAAVAFSCVLAMGVAVASEGSSSEDAAVSSTQTASSSQGEAPSKSVEAE